jgi:hypothetical protein
MARVILVVVVLGLAVLAVGFLGLGAFPPHPATAPVDHVLPNDRFHGGT